jgi:hypothetical protein
MSSTLRPATVMEKARRYADRPVFRLLVTGSRDWADIPMLRAALAQVLAEVDKAGMRLVVVHGDCPSGADFLAEAWVREQRGLGRPVDSHRFPANWAAYGLLAGNVRNTSMVVAGAQRCLAFFAPGAANKGTSDCVKQAQRHHIKVVRYPPTDEQTSLF